MSSSAEKWTVANIPDQTGKIVVITGGNSGIGLEAARELARRGAHVTIACRSQSRAAGAKDSLTTSTGNEHVDFVLLDLASLDSVRACAAELSDRLEHIDLLINNAGIMMPPYEETADGIESQMGINHFGHFALTARLMPMVQRSRNARVVNVSSLAHSWGRMNFDNLTWAGGNGYDSRAAYGRSKLANLLFTRELQRRVSASSPNVEALTAHPGMSETNLGRHLENRWYLKPFFPLASLFTQSAEMGALPTLRAATDPQASGGDYFGPDGRKQHRGHPVRVGCSPRARNDADAAELWRRSEEITGESFDI